MIVRGGGIGKAEKLRSWKTYCKLALQEMIIGGVFLLVSCYFPNVAAFAFVVFVSLYNIGS